MCFVAHNLLKKQMWHYSGRICIFGYTPSVYLYQKIYFQRKLLALSDPDFRSIRKAIKSIESGFQKAIKRTIGSNKCEKYSYSAVWAFNPLWKGAIIRQWKWAYQKLLQSFAKKIYTRIRILVYINFYTNKWGMFPIFCDQLSLTHTCTPIIKKKQSGPNFF